MHGGRKSFDSTNQKGKKRKRRKQSSSPSYLEETSQEIMHPIEVEEERIHYIYGWIGLALSVVSFFLLPFVFSIAGIIVGFVAKSRGVDFLGISAIIVGGVSFLFNLFLLPMM